MLHRYLGMNILFAKAMVQLCTYRVWRLLASLGRALGSTRRRGEAQSRRRCQWSVSQHQQMGALVPIGDSRDRWRGSYRITFRMESYILKYFKTVALFIQQISRKIFFMNLSWLNIFLESDGVLHITVTSVYCLPCICILSVVARTVPDCPQQSETLHRWARLVPNH